MTTINKISAIEILDSRGKPTIKCYCKLDSGAIGYASVPSGASTGKAEAHELRDHNKSRFNGNGCLKAVSNVNEVINGSISGTSFKDQNDLDQALIELDGTNQKSKLGANAILSVSLAFARALATDRNEPLYRYFSNLMGNELGRLPRPTINLFSGGKHAGGQTPIQDLLVVPGQEDLMSSLDVTYRVYQAAAKISRSKYGMRALTADEGGLAPPFNNLNSIFEDANESIEAAGLEPGKDVFFAMDVASSHFFKDGLYDLGYRKLPSEGMIEEIGKWVGYNPLVSIEDGLAEDDWENWPKLNEAIGGKSLVLGDDFLCTNPDRISRAIEQNAANALLLKVNQIGTVTEAARAYTLAKEAGWKVTISARSGETEDDWLADLAVGWQGDQIKIGSITQSERLAKYNRLLEIEKETGLPMNDWPN